MQYLTIRYTERLDDVGAALLDVEESRPGTGPPANRCGTTAAHSAHRPGEPALGRGVPLQPLEYEVLETLVDADGALSVRGTSLRGSSRLGAMARPTRMHPLRRI